MIYGYCRISTQKDKQSFDRQLNILKQHNVSENNIYCERISGGVATKERETWFELMKVVNPGDMIIVSEMSRLARSLQDLIETVNMLIKREIGITFIKENISVGSNGMDAMNRLMFSMFGAFAEFEKSLIQERVKQGLEAKKMQGIKLGRKFKEIDEEDFTYNYTLKNDSGRYAYSINDLMELYQMTKPTIINTAKRLGLQRNNKKG